MYRKFHADHVVVCLEGGSWRREIYPQYKANRRVDEALVPKKDLEENAYFQEVMTTFIEFLNKRTNVTMLQARGLEADDLIARWIDRHPEDQHVIFSGDSDFYQLLASNVKIYDGVKGWEISIDQVLDEKGKPATTRKNIAATKANAKAGKVGKTTKIDPILPPVPEYELFKKIIRGDSTDNVFSSYPGARENGTLKKPGILEAFNDRHKRGYEWNAFVLSEWDKLVGEDIKGNPVTKKVRVIDEMKINEILIDLRKQPDHIKTKMDETINLAITKDPVQMTGIYFMRYCQEMALDRIAKDPNEYAQLLAAPYKKI
jgi:hypothetical protein